MKLVDRTIPYHEHISTYAGMYYGRRFISESRRSIATKAPDGCCGLGTCCTWGDCVMCLEDEVTDQTFRTMEVNTVRGRSTVGG